MCKKTRLTARSFRRRLLHKIDVDSRRGRKGRCGRELIDATQDLEQLRRHGHTSAAHPAKGTTRETAHLATWRLCRRLLQKIDVDSRRRRKSRCRSELLTAQDLQQLFVSKQ